VPTLLKGSTDPVFEGEAQVLNNAIQNIGMGRYQWQLSIVVGSFDWPAITAHGYFIDSTYHYP